jgi:hypothetical protein
VTLSSSREGLQRRGPGPNATIRRRIIQLRACERATNNTTISAAPHHQHLAIQEECRRMEISVGREAAGRAPSPSAPIRCRIVQLRRGERATSATPHQHLSTQKARGRVAFSCSCEAARRAPGPVAAIRCRIIQFRAATTKSPPPPPTPSHSGGAWPCAKLARS